MKPSRTFRPDNLFLNAASALFLFFLLATGRWLLLVLFIVLLLSARKRASLVIDGFHAQSYAHPLSREQVIIPAEKIRAYSGVRKYGPALVLSDTTSVHEIILYEWAFSPASLRAIRESFQS